MPGSLGDLCQVNFPAFLSHIMGPVSRQCGAVDNVEDMNGEGVSLAGEFQLPLRALGLELTREIGNEFHESRTRNLHGAPKLSRCHSALTKLFPFGAVSEYSSVTNLHLP